MSTQRDEYSDIFSFSASAGLFWFTHRCQAGVKLGAFEEKLLIFFEADYILHGKGDKKTFMGYPLDIVQDVIKMMSSKADPTMITADSLRIFLISMEKKYASETNLKEMKYPFRTIIELALKDVAFEKCPTTPLKITPTHFFKVSTTDPIPTAPPNTSYVQDTKVSTPLNTTQPQSLAKMVQNLPSPPTYVPSTQLQLQPLIKPPPPLSIAKTQQQTPMHKEKVVALVANESNPSGSPIHPKKEESNTEHEIDLEVFFFFFVSRFSSMSDH